MDFVVGLPRTRACHDAIWVIIDRLTKSAHFPSINEKLSLDKLVQLYLKETVVREIHYEYVPCEAVMPTHNQLFQHASDLKRTSISWTKLSFFAKYYQSFPW